MTQPFQEEPDAAETGVCRPAPSLLRPGDGRRHRGKSALTGCDAVETLAAAHIDPYRGASTDRVANGLLLRADIHTLFDQGLLAFDPEILQVRLAAVELEWRLDGDHLRTVIDPGRTHRLAARSASGNRLPMTLLPGTGPEVLADLLPPNCLLKIVYVDREGREQRLSQAFHCF